MRRGYLDWMRGLAVLIMIEAHVVDSWTRAADREADAFGWSLIAGGFGAPLFLFLAGLSVVLSASSKLRRLGNADAATRAVVRRGLEIFLLAFVFRLQALALGWGSPRSLLKVDILNIMGPCIVAAALLWRAAGVQPRSDRKRIAIFIAATLLMTLMTPIVRATPLLAGLPDPIEAYIRPIRGLTSFAFFPWAGFVFAGAVLGVGIDRARTRSAETRVNTIFVVTGAAIAVAAYYGSFLPSPYPRSDFWTSSPTYFLLRAGLMTAATGLAYAWGLFREGRWSPVQQLGRTSLFIYWIHIEMVYGLISRPLHKALSLPAAWVALALFAVFMLLCSIAKDRTVRWWRQRPGDASPVVASR